MIRQTSSPSLSIMFAPSKNIATVTVTVFESARVIFATLSLVNCTVIENAAKQVIENAAKLIHSINDQKADIISVLAS